VEEGAPRIKYNNIGTKLFMNLLAFIIMGSTDGINIKIIMQDIAALLNL
jgi:hypothetical protein